MDNKTRNEIEGTPVEESLGLGVGICKSGSLAAGSPKRVIRKLVKLNPTKITKLGLRTEIIQAVSKLKETQKTEGYDRPFISFSSRTFSTPPLNVEEIRSRLKHIDPKESNKAITPLIAEPTRPPEKQREALLSSEDVKLLLNKKLKERAKLSSQTGSIKYERDFAGKVSKFEASPKLIETSANVSVLECETPCQETDINASGNCRDSSEANAFSDGFHGFTNKEISEGDETLNRLCVATGEFGVKNGNTFSSIAPLRSYVNKANGKVRKSSDEPALKASSIRTPCAKRRFTPTNEDVGRKAKTKPPLEYGSRDTPAVIDPTIFNRLSHTCIANPTISPQKAEVCEVSPHLSFRNNSIKTKDISNKTYFEIIQDHHFVLPASSNVNVESSTSNRPPQQIYSSRPPNKGIVILDQQIIKPETPIRTSLIPQKTLKDSTHPCTLTIPISTSKHLDTPERTKLVKVEIEVTDRRGMQPPKKPNDSIKNICKSFVRKMVQPANIKRMTMNPPKQLTQSPSTDSGDVEMRVSRFENETTTLACESYQYRTSIDESGPVEDADQTGGCSQFVQQTINSSTSRYDDQDKDNSAHRTLMTAPNNSNSHLDSKEPMDAVEYILSCTQGSDLPSSAFHFEDEGSDLDDIDWSDDEEECESNILSSTKMENYDNDNRKNFSFSHQPRQVEFHPNLCIINMIKDGQITFETQSDLSPELLSVVSLNEVNLSSEKLNLDTVPHKLIKSEHSLDSNSSDKPSLATQSMSSPPSKIAKFHHLEESENESVPQKKRKQKITHYLNASRAPVNEILSRIKQRMINKGRLTSNVNMPEISLESKEKNTQDELSLAQYDEIVMVNKDAENMICTHAPHSEPEEGNHMSEEALNISPSPNDDAISLTDTNSSDCDIVEMLSNPLEDVDSQEGFEALENTNKMEPMTIRNETEEVSVTTVCETQELAEINQGNASRNTIFECKTASSTTQRKKKTSHFQEDIVQCIELENDLLETRHHSPYTGLEDNRVLKIASPDTTTGSGRCGLKNIPGLKNASSERVRKTTNNKDFLTGVKCKKSDTEDVTKNVGGSSQVESSSKSHRKNTIPEIDRLAKDKVAKNLNAKATIQKNTELSSILGPKSEGKSECSAKLSNSMPKDVGKCDDVATHVKRRGRSKKTPDDSKCAALVDSSSGPIKVKAKLIEKPIAPTKAKRVEWGKPVEKAKKFTGNDYYINPRILVISNREELQREVEVTVESERIGEVIKEEIVDQGDNVRCGACKQLMSHKLFFKHLKTHYGVGWREGIDAPINMSSYREVLNTMVHHMHRNKISNLRCKFCNEVKKSAAGFLTHVQTCLLNDEQLKELMEPCEFCGKMFMPPALWVHLRSCKKHPLNQKTPAKVVLELLPTESKRKSAVKASSSLKAILQSTYSFSIDDLIKPVQKPRGGGMILKWKHDIKKYGVGKCLEKSCSFEATDVNELKAHTKSCVNIRRGGYFCVRCKFYSLDENTVRTHILTSHKKELGGHVEDSRTSSRDQEKEFVASESDSTEDSSGTENDTDSPRTPVVRSANGSEERNIFASTQGIYKKIYTEGILYPELITSDIVLSQMSFDHFKPNLKNSARFGFTKTKDINKRLGATDPPTEWTTLEQFECSQFKDENIIFIGGPITNCSWVPLPPLVSGNTSEYVALSYKKEYKSRNALMSSNTEDSIVLIYEVNVVARNIQPKVLYGVKLSGPVNHFVFLPSGGYAPSMNRLGLLAVASSAADVKIYALPLKVVGENCDNSVNSDSFCRILDLKPSLVLRLNLNRNSKDIGNCKTQCTRLVWSEVKRHNVIAAGFSNGFLGLWDIRENDNITRFCSNGGQYCLPLSYFHATGHSISDLAIHYTLDEPRWLIVTNRMRELRAFDLEDISNPVLILKDGFQKSSLACTVWPVYSENPAMGLDDDYIEDSCVVMTRSLQNVTYKVKHHMHCPSGVNALTFTPWYNALISGCENGDVVLQRYRTFSMENICTNAYPRRFIFFTDIVRLDGKTIPVANSKPLNANFNSETLKYFDSFDSGYNEEYGLIFGGPIPCSRQNKSAVQSIERSTPFSLRPLTRINCVAVCPNIAHAGMLIIGYANGLIRIKLLDYKGFC